MNSMLLFGLHMRRTHARQSSAVRGCLYFVLIGQQRDWRNYIDGRLVLAFAVRLYIYVIIHTYLAHLYVKCEAAKTLLACGSNNQMTTQKCSITGVYYEK